MSITADVPCLVWQETYYLFDARRAIYEAHVNYAKLTKNIC